METWHDNYGVLRERPIRKIVLSTNNAEASITVPDLGFVVDGGKSKRMHYDFATRQEVLKLDNIDVLPLSNGLEELAAPAKE